MQSLLAVVLLVVASLGVAGCRATATPVNAPNPLDKLGKWNPNRVIFPSNDRNWKPDMAVLPRAEFAGNEITVRNIRDFRYQSDDEYVVQYYDKVIRIPEIEHTDFISVPFKGVPSLAHTMLSFEASDGRFLTVSVEARLEGGEQYSPLLGAMRQFELMYVVGDERDMIARRTKHRNADVYVYRTNATPEESQALFVDMMKRMNSLAENPEFYDTLTNNCTTNIVRHVNRISPSRIPTDIRVFLPGLSDQLAYELGLVGTGEDFASLKRDSLVNELANRYYEDPSFSKLIRRR